MAKHPQLQDLDDVGVFLILQCVIQKDEGCTLHNQKFHQEPKHSRQRQLSLIAKLPMLSNQLPFYAI
jgi:hypothetical protein